MVRMASGPEVLVPVVGAAQELPGGCCLSFSRVSLGPDGSLRVDLAPRLPDDYAAENLVAVDLEGDGLDELVAVHYVSDQDGTFESQHYLLRQTPSGWTRAPLPIEQDGGAYMAAVGETDGVPGADLVFIDGESSGVTRVYVEDGELRAEHAPEGVLVDREGGWIAAAIDGLMVLSEGRGLGTARWPRGGTPELLASVDSGPYPSIFALGEGRTARIVQLTDNEFDRSAPLGLRIYDLGLRLLETHDSDPMVERLWDLNRSGTNSLGEVGYRLWPSFGPIPGGVGGQPAMLGAGALVSLDATGEVEVTRAQPLLGTGPVGMAGNESDWLVGGSAWFGLPTSANLYGGFTTESVVAVVPLETLLAPDSENVDPQLVGATRTASAAGEVLATTGDGFEVVVDGDPGTLVITLVGRRTGVAEVVDGPITVPVDPGGDDDDDNERIEATLITITPAGVATATTWDIDVYRQPPEVTAFTESEPFSLRSTIRGRVSDGVSVTVDGRPVELNANGAFGVEVDAPIWPRQVPVVATDPLGRQALEQLEVIGFIDYRGLPWIPIIGVLTVVAGIVLFVRTPRLRPEERLQPDGDGRLEEIDGDLI
jgi:hypothetical protein